MSIAVMKKDFYLDSMKKTDSGREENIAMRKAINFFGGIIQTSDNLKVDRSQVSRWLHKRRIIPIKHALQIEDLTKGKIKAKDLRPDLKWPSSLNDKES